MHTVKSEITQPKLAAYAQSQFEIHTLQWMYMNREMKAVGKAATIEIIWLGMDTGSINTEAPCYQIEDHCLCCVLPGQFRKLNLQANSSGYYISFSIDFLDVPVHKAGFSTMLEPYGVQSGLLVLPTNHETAKEIAGIFGKINKEFNTPFSFRLPVIKAFLQIMMLYLSREIKATPMLQCTYKGVETTRKFMQLLSEKYANMKMVADYAKELYVSPNYLNYTVKKVSGFTASHHIQQFILQEAKRQANRTGATMKEIAYSLGFVDPAHFSRFFKSKSGLNFSSFKKEITYY